MVWLFAANALPLDALLAATGEPSFPRGPGFYYSPVKLVLLLVVYLCWVRTAWWVDHDARQLALPTAVWNPIVLAAGVVGLLAVWSLPWFVFSFVVLLLLYLAPALSYVYVRNQKVPADERVLTEHHFRQLLRLAPRNQDGEAVRQGVPVRFITKGATPSEDDEARVARAEGSKGFKAAKEMVYEAIQARATDIHMEPTKQEMTVRYRIDGILQPAAPFKRAMGDSVLNIFKVLANLDITEKRKPQDGSLSAQVEDRFVDFRVATAGSVVGEKMVLRILDKSKQLVDLTHLGMRDKLRDQIHGIVSQPHGMFIVCGPTGAGKSTTLYACLNEIDRYQKNVITIEDPVEYQIDNVTQIEINTRAGKTFASELRSILRQDPDVIYIGEIRDKETAEIACQAAQTGHMVFTTLHANDTVTAVARLLDLGVQPFLIGSAVSAILGQRLVRILCPECKIRYKPDPEMLRKANLPADKIKFFYKPHVTIDDAAEDKENVCPHCNGTGYRGRTGVFELLVVNDRIRDLIKENPNFNAIKQEAVKAGMKYLQEDGIRQVIEGRTSIQELLRVSK